MVQRPRQSITRLTTTHGNNDNVYESFSQCECLGPEMTDIVGHHSFPHRILPLPREDGASSPSNQPSTACQVLGEHGSHDLQGHFLVHSTSKQSVHLILYNANLTISPLPSPSLPMAVSLLYSPFSFTQLPLFLISLITWEEAIPSHYYTLFMLIQHLSPTYARPPSTSDMQ